MSRPELRTAHLLLWYNDIISAQRNKALRKQRTRSHIIADLSVNHVERFVLRCGYVIERVIHDYGFDLVMRTFSDEGYFESGDVLFQLKATDSLPIHQDGLTIPRTVSRADLSLWIEEPMPVILIDYDAPNDTAYWLYVQAYWRERGMSLSQIGETTTLYLRKTEVLDEGAIRRFAGFKKDVVAQLEGVVHENE